MIRQRIRIRFAKQDDLRWLSHRDLLRTWERLIRRANLPLSMTEGFHPKPRMNFPSALAVGITGLDEVVELELCEERTAEGLIEQLPPLCPPGLIIHGVEIVPEGTRKPHVRSVTFEIPVPVERRPALLEKIDALLAETSHIVTREQRTEPLDIRPWIEELKIIDGTLQMRLHVQHEGSARPREILEALAVADLEMELGARLIRTRVELHAENPLLEKGLTT